jgi:acyl-CoA hydrolase
MAKASRLVTAPGCGAPTTLLKGITDHADQFHGAHVYGGLLLGEGDFLQAAAAGRIRYATWHPTPVLQPAVAAGTVGFYPVRGSRVPALVRSLAPDVALIRVSPPDRFGFCSLGPSVSYVVDLIKAARCVIAEVDPDWPVISCGAMVDARSIDILVDAQEPPVEYAPAEPSEISRRISENIIPLIPEQPLLQIGIGSIPESLLAGLQAQGIGDLRFVGMAVDGLADLYDAGLIATDELWPHPPVSAAEFMGTRRLMSFANGNPCVGGFPTSVGISARALGLRDRLVSIISAFEVDVLGQVSGERLGSRQLSGVGGSVDFVDASLQSRAGTNIVALPSTASRAARSRIVGSLTEGATVSITRASVDFVVTENGVADLRFGSEAERRDSLMKIAGEGLFDDCQN